MKDKNFYILMTVIYGLLFILHSISFERSWFLYLGGQLLGFGFFISIISINQPLTKA